jgi:hypothetical protein
MSLPLGSQPRPRRDSVRRQARREAETSAKLKALVNTVHWKRAAILRYITQWGLAHTQRWTIDSSIPDGFRLVHVLVDSELCSSRCARPQPSVA